MAIAGHMPVRKSPSTYFYRCPLPGHQDSDASFAVERNPDGDTGLQRFHCLGCKQASGSGAIDLQAVLMGVEANGEKFTEVCERLARDFHIPLDGHDLNVWYKRCEKVAPQSAFSYVERPWTRELLRSLGCESRMMYESGVGDTEESTGIVLQSWGDGYYDRGRVHDGPNFDPSEITRVFGCHPVSSFTLPQKKDKDGKAFSTRITSTNNYPVFVIDTRDGTGRIKKYEPYCITDKFGASYKNTWYYLDAKSKEKGRRTGFAGRLYGDCDIMDCLMGDDVLPQDSSPLGNHPVDQVSVKGADGKYSPVPKFRKVIICSGLRDAMNVYFHSDAHVVYPHSESSGISARMMKRLMEVSDTLYILYDTDRVGQTNARAINMQYPELRNVELPADLSSLTERRTDKPCKDAASYFEYYGQVLQHKGQPDINHHFQSLLSKSVPLKFWQRRCVSTQREADAGIYRYRYQIIIDSMTRFLTYSGLCQYDETGTGDCQFVFIRDNVVETISEKAVLVRARQIMKDYLCSHPSWNDPELSTVISTSKGINQQTIREIGKAELNFRSFGEDFDFLFFRNGALRVTATERVLVPYRDFPYNVNRDSIIQADWKEVDVGFTITPNQDMKRREEKHRANLERMKKEDAKAARMENMRWTNELRLWQYSLAMDRPMDRMPVTFQFLYDTCRVFWKEEESALAAGKQLDGDSRQFQDAHFINKAAGLGYMLNRFRTGARQQMGQLVDYRVSDEKKNTGRNGKSLIAGLLGCVRVGCKVDGKSFKTSPDSIAKNFRDYRPSVHGYIYIDDLMRNFNAELLFNMSSSITVKNLYRDEVTVSPDTSAKILFSSNRCFDMTDPSTFGRLYPMMVSDYYHAATVDGQEEVSPYRKFGHTIGGMENADEYMETCNILVRFLQFYLSHKRVIIPPMESNGMSRFVHRAIRDQRFVGWAVRLFSGNVFGTPIPKQDLIVSLFQYKGMSVTKQAVEAYSKSPEFSDMIHTYCSLMSIDVNPDVVFTRQSDIARGLPRAQTFAYDFGEDGRLTGKRSKRHNVSCYYFFRDGDAPADPTKVVTAHDDSDPFAEGYIPEE